MAMGSMVTLNQSIDVDTATLVSREFEYEVLNETISEKELLKREEIKSTDLKPRPPVVTIMGHVDHGKTTLLDAIRKSDVALGEAGGITQHIGAYMVDIGNGRSITFIDTPGHEAFSAMRARGAKTTDIVILVVAADDGVMPQTKEAIAHAKEAGVPIIVAVNKIDKPGAQPERVKKQLSDLDLMPEDWGGKTIYALVSAKGKTGIKELLELILLQADVLELQASPSHLAEGVILEAKMAKGLGPVATVLIQQGTLVKGDILISGTTTGKVRLLLDDRGKQLKAATPSFAVEVSGLDSVPQVGDPFFCFKNEEDSKRLVQFRIDQKRQAIEKEGTPPEKITLEGLYEKMQEGEVKELKLIVKADVQGSVEVIRQSLEKLSTPQVKMNVIFSMTGAISESDVNLASASNAIIIGFNIRPDIKAQELAKSQKVDIRLYSIIYDLLEDMKKSMVGQLEPTFKESVLGRAEVRNVFKISKVGAIAGCNVVSGKITRTAKARLLRDSVVIYTGKISSLKRFKDDAKEVLEGYECGIGLENYNDVKENDVIEAFMVEEIAGVLS
ncbi:MAG: translation initiation factor IF-2 [Deltaproteobacteria bacterium RIFCSPLOWO2_01_FULL_38_9]|nr:MAG: translation initiation factor IF-2 [Deltaproteobacteria bacterium RIFCSPLOWO2_01_FULL_38_9]